MRAARIVFAKEVRENLRDRRTLTSALVTGPLIGPLLLALVLHVVVDQAREAATKPLAVPIVGVANAPRLVQQLKQLGLVIRPAPADPEAEVLEQHEDVVLRIPPEYGPHWDKGEPAPVEIVFDSSRQDGEKAAERLRRYLQAVGQQTSAIRMLARGLSPQVTQPLSVLDRDVSTAQSRGSVVFGMMPYLFMMTILIGGMYLAIDTAAGERERQSLEPLFVNPAPRWHILLGKLSATWLFAAMSLCLSLATFALVSPFLPADQLGIVLDVGPRFALRVLVVMVPSIVLVGTLQTLVSAFAKSFREAQTYLSLLMLVPMIPSLLLSISPLKPKLWMFVVPLLGQQFSIMRFLRGESVSALQLGLCCGGTLVLAALLVLVTARIYDSEKLAIST